MERYAKGNFKENSIPVTEVQQFVIKEDIKIANNTIKLIIADAPGNGEKAT